MSKRQAVFPTRMTLTTFKTRQVGAQKGAWSGWDDGQRWDGCQGLGCSC